MKRYSLLLGIIIVTVARSSLLAQERAALQPNATVLSILQGNAGKAVELHLRSGEKVGGKVGSNRQHRLSFPSNRRGVLRRIRRCERYFGGGSSCRWQIATAKWSDDNPDQDLLDAFGLSRAVVSKILRDEIQ